MQCDQFVVKHFAGSVTYDVAGFLEKNNDSLQVRGAGKEETQCCSVGDVSNRGAVFSSSSNLLVCSLSFESASPAAAVVLQNQTVTRRVGARGKDWEGQPPDAFRGPTREHPFWPSSRLAHWCGKELINRFVSARNARCLLIKT